MERVKGSKGHEGGEALGLQALEPAVVMLAEFCLLPFE